jgi:hypothetical protein
LAHTRPGAAGTSVQRVAGLGRHIPWPDHALWCHNCASTRTCVAWREVAWFHNCHPIAMVQRRAKTRM